MDHRMMVARARADLREKTDDAKALRLELIRKYRAALNEQYRTPAQAVFDLVFTMMADIGVFNREHPELAIRPVDCVATF
jgi:hypothetical protein